MADVVAQSTQPALAAVKLAWWRERLEELDEGKVPAEPRLQAAAEELLQRGIAGADLAQLEDGWAALVEETPDTPRATERGARLFEIGAKLLGAQSTDDLAAAGRTFAAVDVARRGLTDAILPTPDAPPPVIPRPLRSLSALGALAIHDRIRGGPPFEPEATPGRAWTLLRHRLTGAFPR